ncbi:AAA family ATPase, partial [Rhodococcus zopfii]|uniref:AAA family ATPase n=1 Tax=Rhodococcus zopfii TaxID=43772 RepID=UPI00111149AE
MIDISKRFPMTTLREAYERAKDVNPWVFEGLIASSVTTIYGKSKVGKSYLVSSMLLSLLLPDREFLGVQPSDPTKVWKPVILWTDPDSDNEYGRRLIPELPEDVDIEIPSFYVGRTTQSDEWEALTDHLLSQGYNFVILDNLMGATGDTNDALAVTAVYDGLTRLTSRGVPVVVLHHESEKGVKSRVLLRLSVYSILRPRKQPAVVRSGRPRPRP